MFNLIDFNSWNRNEMFYYFSKIANTGYSITVEVDITKFYDIVKKNGYKFFPSYLWVVTKNINKQMEFKVAYEEDKLGYYDTLTPLYAKFNYDDKTFSMVWTEYSDSFKEFHRSYLIDSKSDKHGVLAKEGVPPKNAYTISTVPWIRFKHFAVHNYSNTSYFFPSIEAGKYEKVNDKLILPLSLTCHHATTDGYHIDVFLKDLQNDLDNFGKYL